MSSCSPAPQFWGKFLAPLELLSQKCFIFFVAGFIWNVVNMLTSSLSTQVSYFDTQINKKKHIPWLTENQKILPAKIVVVTEVICQGGGGGGGVGGVLPILAYTWRVRSKGVPLSGFRYQEKAGVSLVGLYQRVGNSVISVLKKAQRANTCISRLWKSRVNDLVLWLECNL